MRPESCSAVVKLNLKTQSLNPPQTCVCVCVVMRMYTACTAAKYHTFICYTLPFPVLKHRRPCVRRLKFFSVLAADFQYQPFFEKNMSFFHTSRPLCSRHNREVQIRRQWWIKPSKLLFHRLGVCADEVSVDAKGLLVRDALCYNVCMFIE